METKEKNVFTLKIMRDTQWDMISIQLSHETRFYWHIDTRKSNQ